MKKSPPKPLLNRNDKLAIAAAIGFWLIVALVALLTHNFHWPPQ